MFIIRKDSAKQNFNVVINYSTIPINNVYLNLTSCTLCKFV